MTHLGGGSSEQMFSTEGASNFAPGTDGKSEFQRRMEEVGLAVHKVKFKGTARHDGNPPVSPQEAVRNPPCACLLWCTLWMCPMRPFRATLVFLLPPPVCLLHASFVYFDYGSRSQECSVLTKKEEIVRNGAQR